MKIHLLDLGSLVIDRSDVLWHIDVGTPVRFPVYGVYIDHPEGVTLALCERVTRLLPEVREDHALEVSSPGIERPLTKPAHFRRFLGRRARVRTEEDHEGHKSFTGELVGASDAEVTIAAPTGVVAIPYGDITRSNLVED